MPAEETFNLFTATTCKISELTDARKRLQTVHFPSCNIYFQFLHFHDHPSTCQCKKKKKKKKREEERFNGLKFRGYWSFLSDIMAVKGLSQNRTRERALHKTRSRPWNCRVRITPTRQLHLVENIAHSTCRPFCNTFTNLIHFSPHHPFPP